MTSCLPDADTRLTSRRSAAVVTARVTDQVWRDALDDLAARAEALLARLGTVPAPVRMAAPAPLRLPVHTRARIEQAIARSGTCEAAARQTGCGLATARAVYEAMSA